MCVQLRQAIIHLSTGRRPLNDEAVEVLLAALGYVIVMSRASVCILFNVILMLFFNHRLYSNICWRTLNFFNHNSPETLICGWYFPRLQIFLIHMACNFVHFCKILLSLKKIELKHVLWGIMAWYHCIECCVSLFSVCSWCKELPTLNVFKISFLSIPCLPNQDFVACIFFTCLARHKVLFVDIKNNVMSALST